MSGKPNRWLWSAATALAAFACAWPALAQGDPLGVRVGQGATTTRVVIDSGATLSVSPEPASGGQLILDVKGAGSAGAGEGAGAGLVRAWRLSTGDDGATRLSLDLTSETSIMASFAIPPDATHRGWRYVIDLAAGRLAPRVATARVETAMASDPKPPAIERRRFRDARATLPKKVIVIDAGHGGHDPGARGPEADEKDVTLAAALQLRRKLLRDGHYRVVMTRSDDTFVALEDRVRIARRAGADLFIALHADSAGDNDAPHGASVYTLSDHGETRVKEVLDGHEWFDHAAAHSDPGVKRILLDLTQRSTLNRSNLFAQVLVDRISEKVDVLPHTHRDAGYFVLLAPDVPAVLLEMGFITSRQDEARLTDPTRRGELMDAVAAAIDQYFRGAVELAAN